MCNRFELQTPVRFSNPALQIPLAVQLSDEHELSKSIVDVPMYICDQQCSLWYRIQKKGTLAFEPHAEPGTLPFRQSGSSNCKLQMEIETQK